MISEQNLHYWNYSKTKLSSWKVFYYKVPYHRIYPETKIVSAASSDLQNQLTRSRFAHPMILLALVRKSKGTWPSGYKYPVHVHNIHSLATIHLLISTRRNSFRLPPQFLTSLTWSFSVSLLSEQNPIFTTNQHPPEEPKLQPICSISRMVSVNLWFQKLVEKNPARNSKQNFGFQIHWVTNQLVIRKL